MNHRTQPDGINSMSLGWSGGPENGWRSYRRKGSICSRGKVLFRSVAGLCLGELRQLGAYRQLCRNSASRENEPGEGVEGIFLRFPSRRESPTQWGRGLAEKPKTLRELVRYSKVLRGKAGSGHSNGQQRLWEDARMDI